jgi:glucokinase-like ROK family protein
MNKLSIVDHIRRSQSGISRAELAETMGVSRSTVSTIVNSLIAQGLVLERGAGVSRGGRRPIVLEVNRDAGRVMGVDIGASHLTVVLADLMGCIVAQVEEPLSIERGPETCLVSIFRLVDAALAHAGVSMAEVLAIGVGVPGPVVAEHGIVTAPPIMPGWDAFPIRDRLQAHWGTPCILDNDADLGALGEWNFGAGRGETHLAYIKVGTGIGCGLLLDGQLYRGVLGTAGEIGHVTVSQAGPPCTCGNYGCLEAMAGGRAIGQRAELAVRAGQRTLLAQTCHGRAITALDVALAAEEGDAVSQQLLADAGRHIGSALASLINLLNPGLVLIGGGVTGAGDRLFDSIHHVAVERTMRASRHVTRVMPAALGRLSIAMGGVSQALARTFQLQASAAGATSDLA